MRYIRPFNIEAATSAGQWLLAPEEEAGCSIRLLRGDGGAKSSSTSSDRFAVVLSGHAELVSADATNVANVRDVIFIPAGASAAVRGTNDSVWVEIDAPLGEDLKPLNAMQPHVISVDPSRFEGAGFAYQSLVDRTKGAQSLRINVLQVQPGAGSPDWHIHAFAQMYLVLEGEMTIDIGRARRSAGPGTFVFFPAGVVHRNFNASNAVERHMTLLVPEPAEGEVFDYAVTMHEHEAELLAELPPLVGSAAKP